MKMKDEKMLVRIKQLVELGIFDTTEVRTKLDGIFDREYEEIVARCDELLIAGGFDKEKIEEFNLNYVNIKERLKKNFCQSIYKEVIKMTLMGQGNYNMIENVLSIISEREFIKDAIMGKPLLYALIDELKTNPKYKDYDSICWGATISLMELKISD